MGSAQSSVSSLSNFHTKDAHRSYKIISKHHNSTELYALKTFSTSSKSQHEAKVNFFKTQRQKVDTNQELTRLIQVFEESQQTFCTTTFKLNLIYEYSPVNMASEMGQRRPSGQKMSRFSFTTVEPQYFNYEDLCNILYSCLSALWIVKDNIKYSIDPEIKRFGTVFLTLKDILIMEDGAIKVLDPHLLDFDDRYTFKGQICYSPEKIADFYRTDDEKSAIYELGLLMLQICLLYSFKNTTQSGVYSEQAVRLKFKQAKSIYASALEDVVGVNIFDIIENMIQTDRQKRYDLQHTINYAEEMYEQHDSSRLSLVEKSNTGEKINLERTNHSSSVKKYSPDLHKSREHKHHVLSPRIDNFVIEEVQPENQQQQSMLESLQVQNPTKINDFTSSVTNYDIFKNVKLNDSYNYNWRKEGQNKQNQEQRLFTDPDLLRTIRREVEEIQRRKQQKLRVSELKKSDIIERKDRHEENDYVIPLKISNKVYMTEN